MSQNGGGNDEECYAGPICYHYNFGYAPDIGDGQQQQEDGINQRNEGIIRRRQ